MKWIRNILKGVSLTTALFIFQACYGTPSWLYDQNVRFKVVSAQDDTPIKDVQVYTRVSANNNLTWNLCGYTGEDGLLDTYVAISVNDSPQFRFNAEGQPYEVKDTTIARLGDLVVIRLKAKQ